MVSEKHHVIPISIGGWDIGQNMIVVSKQEHADIHKTLNIPYQFIREFREKTNHKLIPDMDYISELRALHCKYFEKVNELGEFIFALHINSIELQIEYIEMKYGLARCDRPNSKHFDMRLYQYHDILWKICQKTLK